MAKVIKCYVCKHPNRQKVDEALRAGVTQSEVQRTLCPEVRKHSIQRHFAMDHHLQELGADWTPVTVMPTRTKRTVKTKHTKRTNAGAKDIIKVHWELPRDLVKKLKHEAVDQDISTVEIVRAILDKAL